MIIKTSKKTKTDEELKAIEEDAQIIFQKLLEERKTSEQSNQKEKKKKETASKNKPLPKNDEEVDPIDLAYEKYQLIGETGTTVLEFLLSSQKGEEVKSSVVGDELGLSASNLSHAARRLEEGKLNGYHHAEGNSDAHIKASLMGFSLQVLFENKQLVLGTWQGIYFCEFDGPRRRQVVIKVLPVG